ncbi:unnamed protein product [Brassica napus]|uniref:(rape) hypothetical protein n=1 Tax=Brassica napus TaxID=3708 RepID=A0A817B740_BRANA|nr:unnamed protein product [Brassica napus]
MSFLSCTTGRCRKLNGAGESFYCIVEKRLKRIFTIRSLERECLSAMGTFRRRTIHGNLWRLSLKLHGLLRRRIFRLTTLDSSPLSSASLALCSGRIVETLALVVYALDLYKICSWLAIIFCAQSLANMRNLENDLKQISMAMMFAVMGLVTNYLGPNRPAAKK